MSIFSAIDGSIKSQVLQPPRPTALFMLLSKTQSHGCEGVGESRPPRRPAFSSHRRSLLGSTHAPANELESCFIAALISAGRCRKHAHTQPDTQRTAVARREKFRLQGRPSVSSVRCYSTSTTPRQGSQGLAFEISQEEARDLVDIYQTHPRPARRPLVLNWSAMTEKLEPTQDAAEPKIADARSEHGDNVDQSALSPELHNLLRRARDLDTPAEDVFQQYMDLPMPRLKGMPLYVRHALMKKLAVVERKDARTVFQYMTVFNDTLASGDSPSIAEWNSAMHLTSRFAHGDERQLAQALELWRVMEGDYNTKAQSMTFNILFDGAAKAGKFVLADMLFKEMKHRELKMDRYFRTGWIYYQGLKGSGHGVRKAYEDLVEAGEIVDSVVITCVISSLIASGESAAAEQIFERMKRLHADKVGAQMSPTDWRQKKAMGKWFSSVSNMSDKERVTVAQMAPIAPSEQTYRTLIHHHVSMGNIDRVEALRREMGRYGIEVPGRIWYDYFRGFRDHGGSTYSSWTEKSLEKTFSLFVKSVDSAENPTYLSTSMVGCCIQAFITCVSRKRARQVFETLLERWKPADEEMKEVERHLRSDEHEEIAAGDVQL